MAGRLGRYVVLRHLASGGMADVLLARCEGIAGFERYVVLKRIRPEHAGDPRFVRMFLAEARVAAGLHHQHIVQVHDVGEADGEYFIAMEYLHGEDVRSLLSAVARVRRFVPLGHVLAIVSATAAGLHYAHERRGPDQRPLGVVHRDVSPSNVLVGYDGAIKIVDFGIAKVSSDHETRSGLLKGKVSYMSPEQCMGAEVDRRSDVYSLGVVLYELCTTTRLFDGENDYLVMEQIIGGRISPPRVHRPELPAELSTIILTALAPDRDHRYATADELRVAIDRFAARSGLTASTASIAGYLRSLFGDKPEPWLALDSAPLPVFDEHAGPVARRSRAWTEPPPRSELAVPAAVPVRRPSEADGRAAGPASAEPVPVPARLPSAVPVDLSPGRDASRTESRMAWESQRLRRAAWGITPAKLALSLLSMAAAVWVAIWSLSDLRAAADQPVTAESPRGSGSATASVEATAAPPSGSAASSAASDGRAPTAGSGVAPGAPAAGSAGVAPGTPATGPAGVAPGTPATGPAGVAPGAPAAGSAGVAPGAPAAGSAGVAPGAPAAGQAGLAPAAPGNAAAPVQLPGAVVERVAAASGRQLAKCRDGAQHGEVVIRFGVDARGKVIRSQASTVPRRPRVAACVLDVVRRWQFPPQPGAGGEGAYTLSFQ